MSITTAGNWNNPEVKTGLLLVPVPNMTSTYKPVSHGSIINSVQEFCYRKNVKVTQEGYKVARNGNQVLAKYTLDLGDEHLKYQIAFKNSYDKSMSLAFCSGGEVFICSNGAIRGERTYKKKHQGSIVKELEMNIQSTWDTIDDEFEAINADLTRLKSVQVEEKLLHELTGRMFLEEEILNTEQLQCFKRELSSSKYFKTNSAYDIYNNITEALKSSHPTNYIDKHVKLHKLFTTEFA